VAVSEDPVRAIEPLFAKCPQCGGQVALEDGAIFLDCPYCDTALYVEERAVYARIILAPKMKDWREAEARVEAWAGETRGRWAAKAMQEMMQGMTLPEMRYFPVWVLRTHTGQAHVEPAAVTAATEMWKLDVEAGQVMDALPRDEDLPMPEVPRQAALAWAARRGVDPGTVAEMGLTYVPVYVLRCAHEGEMFTVVVEASTGRVISDSAPATLGLSWQAISYLSYGSFIVAGVVSGLLKVVIWIGWLLLSELQWSPGDPAEALDGSYAWSCSCQDCGPSFASPVPFIVNAALWLATVFALVMVFSGRWKLFRTRGRTHGKR
jgi:hypothetical protein